MSSAGKEEKEIISLFEIRGSTSEQRLKYGIEVRGSVDETTAGIRGVIRCNMERKVFNATKNNTIEDVEAAVYNTTEGNLGHMYKGSIQTITSGQPQYPALLKEIKGFPKMLFYIGNLDIISAPCVAVVGSRNTTEYGRRMAVAIAKRLGEKGVTVVSGMAQGIDTCAHTGALKGGGNTAAVLGCGADICYPKKNHQLKQKIEEKGVIISEYPAGTEAERYYFPQRNRIISGLSLITVVVQARNNSGALITAELAAEQGREVYAVPGNIDSQYNLGSNKLIKEGANPLVSIEDILEPLGLLKMEEEEVKNMLSDTEQKIYNMIQGSGEMTIDEICRKLSKPPSYVASIVAVMEMKGFVFSALGKIFIAKQ